MRQVSRPPATTPWGVVLAVGFVAATLALNAPGGSNSIAGRALNGVMVKLFPPQAASPAAPAPPLRENLAPAAPVATVPAPTPVAPAAPQAAPRKDGEAPASDTRMAESAIGPSAVRARANMSHAPAQIEFRKVYAVITPGAFNAEAPGKPFLGFCGELQVPEGEGWGRPGWKPFFISETASLPARGQGPYLDMANPSAVAKCADAKPSTDYSKVFQAGETDVLPAYMRFRPGAP